MTIDDVFVVLIGTGTLSLGDATHAVVAWVLNAAR